MVEENSLPNDFSFFSASDLARHYLGASLKKFLDAAVIMYMHTHVGPLLHLPFIIRPLILLCMSLALEKCRSIEYTTYLVKDENSLKIISHDILIIRILRR